MPPRTLAAAATDIRALPSVLLFNPPGLAELARVSGLEPFPAQIFSGPEGMGKTTLALAEACAANCLEPVNGGGCGRCRQCKRLLANLHPDLTMISPESESQGVKVEQVRALDEKLQYRPFEARYRYVVIAKAETMSETASNCLLKTLEEPPPQTVFILETANHAQLLPTIRSRCRIFKFLPVEAETLQAWLASQGHRSEEAQLAGRLAHGAPGGALSRLSDKPWWVRRRDALDVFCQLTGTLSPSGCAELADVEARRFAGANWRDRLLEYIDFGATWLRDGLQLSIMDSPRIENVDRTAALQKTVRHGTPLPWANSIEYALEARLQTEGNIGGKAVLSLLFRQIRDAFAD